MVEEETLKPGLGTGQWGIGAETVYPESAKDTAGRIPLPVLYDTLRVQSWPASTQPATSSCGELDDWWTRFTSWVGILTGQDFVGLGGENRRGATRDPGRCSLGPGGSDGHRHLKQFRSYSTPNRLPSGAFQLHDLEACVTATTNHDPPPEWQVHPRRAIAVERPSESTGRHRRRSSGRAGNDHLIDTYLDDTNVTDVAVRQALAKGYNNLGAKNALLKLLRPRALVDLAFNLT